MTPEEFFEKIEKYLKSAKSDSPIGVENFIRDIKNLIEDWEEEYGMVWND